MTTAATSLDAPASAGPSLAQSVAFSNEFGLALLIALAFAAFAILLPGFAAPFSLFTIGRQIGIALSVFYRFTTAGPRMLAAGANPRAAEISGVRTGRTIAACHMVTGGLAAPAGLMFTARTGAAVPGMAGHLGQDWLLPAFLAPVLGGTPLSGGPVAVAGTFLGACFVSIITAGLLQLQVGAFWIQAFLGLLLLLAAVLADRARHQFLRRRGLV